VGASVDAHGHALTDADSDLHTDRDAHADTDADIDPDADADGDSDTDDGSTDADSDSEDSRACDDGVARSRNTDCVTHYLAHTDADGDRQFGHRDEWRLRSRIRTGRHCRGAARGRSARACAANVRGERNRIGRSVRAGRRRVARAGPLRERPDHARQEHQRHEPHADRGTQERRGSTVYESRAAVDHRTVTATAGSRRVRRHEAAR